MRAARGPALTSRTSRTAQLLVDHQTLAPAHRRKIQWKWLSRRNLGTDILNKDFKKLSEEQAQGRNSVSRESDIFLGQCWTSVKWWNIKRSGLFFGGLDGIGGVDDSDSTSLS